MRTPEIKKFEWFSNISHLRVASQLKWRMIWPFSDKVFYFHYWKIVCKFLINKQPIQPFEDAFFIILPFHNVYLLLKKLTYVKSQTLMHSAKSIVSCWVKSSLPSFSSLLWITLKSPPTSHGEPPLSKDSSSSHNSSLSNALHQAYIDVYKELLTPFQESHSDLPLRIANYASSPIPSPKNPNFSRTVNYGMAKTNSIFCIGLSFLKLKIALSKL